MAESFYGGQPANFSIVKTYLNVAAMEAEFQSATCPVTIGSYVVVSDSALQKTAIYQRELDGSARWIGDLFGVSTTSTSAPSGGSDGATATAGIQNVSFVPFDDVTLTTEYNLSTGSGLIAGNTPNDGKVIKWRYGLIRDANTNDITEVKIGMQVPYPVIELDATIAEGTYNADDLLIQENTDSPYHYKYHLTLPPLSGVTFSDLSYVASSDLAQTSLPIYEQGHLLATTVFAENGIYANKYFLIYVKTVNGNSNIEIIGEYKTLTDIYIDENDGYLKVKYLTDSEGAAISDSPLKWITSLSLNAGILTVNYNIGNPDEFTDILVGIEKIVSTPGGKLFIKSNNSVLYNKIYEMPQITDINWDSNNSTLTITKTIDDYDSSLNLNEPVSLEDLNSITVNTISETLVLNSINTIRIKTETNGDKRLLVQYSDVNKQGNIEYQGITGFTDVGSLKGYNDLLIGTFISDKSAKTDITTITNNITWLNTTWSTGRADAKCVAMGLNSENTIALYGFDYDDNTWKFICNYGYVDAAEDKNDIIVATYQQITEQTNMPNKAYWFRVETWDI